jgi:hypothetical protein
MEVQQPAQARGRNVAADVPQAAAWTVPKPAGRHVDLENDHVLDAPAVALDGMEQRPAGFAGRVQPDDRQTALALAGEQTALQDAWQAGLTRL